MSTKTIVLGLGNPLMGDEGIGTALVEKAGAVAEDRPNVRFLDAGTGGMNLIHHLEGYDKAILIDCALMGTEPGTIRRFTPDEVESIKSLAHQSLHEADILRIIEIARELDQCPAEIVLFGIEPVKIEVIWQLSEQLTANLDKYIEMILAELD